MKCSFTGCANPELTKIHDHEAIEEEGAPEAMELSVSTTGCSTKSVRSSSRLTTRVAAATWSANLARGSLVGSFSYLNAR
ncbi:hypothetical protein PF004_g32682 [Phytophthora fragariae]|uniref:Uncharacterized protein n=1 Tax=Phytophthora fragariae TaxID=53985 RepID=A0A6G0M766_9STRA|nr:hypothetical protein PF004_g32682 [Phytophthora fragariae]